MIDVFSRRIVGCRASTSIRTDLALAALEQARDAYDNALAETMIGLFKTEVVHNAGPWRSFDAVEYATLEWLAWFNTTRLLEPLGYRPPVRFEAQYHRTVSASAEPALK